MSLQRASAAHYAPAVPRISVLLLTASLLSTAACGGDSDEEDGGAGGSGGKGAPFALPSVSTAVIGEEPTTVSNTAAPAETTTEILTRGTGRPVGAGDVIVADVKGQVWDIGGVELPAFVNTFTTGVPVIQPVGAIVPAFEQALPGVPVGSRVLLVAPPAAGFGEQGNQGIGVFPTDSLIFVVDVLDAFAADAVAAGTKVQLAGADLPKVGGGKDPKITVPKIKAPTKLVDRLLLRGDGEKVATNRSVVVQYTGVLWRNGEEFDTSWLPDRGPFAAYLGTPPPDSGASGVIEGWNQGLVGERVGSRVLLVVPPEFGYGPAGNEAGGIKGTDTLVFVIDILGTYGTAPVS